MKRVYRIRIDIEKTFERKATKEAKAIRDQVVRMLSVPGFSDYGWKVIATKIGNRAVPERSPTFNEVMHEAQERQEDASLARLQEIADRIAAPFPHLTKPRLAWKGNRYCPSFSGHRAHAHIGRGRWGRGAYRMKNGRSRPIPRGLICLDRSIGVDLNLGHVDSVEHLLAHEIAHLKSQRGNQAQRQADAERELYETFKFGRVIEPIIPDWLFALPLTDRERCQYPGCENRERIGWHLSGKTEPRVDADGKTWYVSIPDRWTCDEYLHRKWGEAWALRSHTKPSDVKYALRRAALSRRRGR